MKPSTTTATSVFDMARAANAGRPKKAPNQHPLPSSIPILSGVPIPQIRSGGNYGVYTHALKQMAVGQCVQLPLSQAKSFYARAKTYSKTTTPPQHYTLRKLPDGMGGVWRDQ